MEFEMIAGMIFSLLVVAMVAGTALLFPLARRLGAIMERYLEQNQVSSGVSDDRLLEELQKLSDRVAALSERQEFVERLLEPRTGPSEPPSPS